MNKSGLHPKPDNASTFSNYLYAPFIEDNPIGIKIAFALVGCVSVISSVLAIVALRRTKKSPPSAKFLATCLLTIDCMFICVSSVRKLVHDPLANTSLQAIGNTVIQLAYFTVAIMSVERFFMFHSPMIYVRRCTLRVLRTVLASVWVSVIVSSFTVRYGLCYVKFRSLVVFDVSGVCNQITTAYYSFLVITTVFTCSFSYYRIFKIVQGKQTTNGDLNLSMKCVFGIVRGYKGTSLVLVYASIIIGSLFVYLILIILLRQNYLDMGTFRIMTDAVTHVNCFFDPFLYVLWFKECQLEVLKMFSFLGENVRTQVVKMKMEVFDIVISDCHAARTTKDNKNNQTNNTSTSV